MNVLQVNDNDMLGARFNGYALNMHLRAQGDQCHQLVWNKLGTDPTVRRLGGWHRDRDFINREIEALHGVYGTQAVLSPFGYDLLFQPWFHEADVVNLHLIHNPFFSILHLPIITRLKPTIWTLHDPWAAAGHCVHPFHCEQWKTGCGQCPLLDVAFPVDKDVTALNWEMKRLTYQQCDMELVVASRWMAERIEASPLLRHLPLHVIPFGVDCDVFRPPDDKAEAKRALGVDPAHLVVGLRAIGGEFKGLDVARSAIERMRPNQPVTVITLHDKGLLEDLRIDHRVIDLGWIDGDEALRRAYGAADLFLMPSEAESFGMMAVEAMACGVPSVVTHGTALPETVMADRGGGIAVPARDSEALAEAATGLLNDDSRRLEMSRQARRLACEHYGVERYVTRTREIYERAIERRRADHAAQQIADRIIAELRPHAVEERESEVRRLLGRSTLMRSVWHAIGKPISRWLRNRGG